MKRWIALIVIILGGAGALFFVQTRKVGTPVGPAALLRWLAGAQREITRVPAAAKRISDEEEIRIGNQMAQQHNLRFRTGGQDADSRAVQAYVSLIGARVSGRAHRKLPYKFHYIPGRNFINAFALPGGQLFIGEGLIALMDSEDELAAVLGHEIEHIDHYHCAERVQTEAALRRIPLGGLLGIPVEVFEAGYSKDQELEADREGTRLAVWAGYSPLGAIRMFEAFDRLYRRSLSPAKDPQQELSRVALQTLEGYFRSHPVPSERIDQIQRMIADNHWEKLISERNLEVAEALRSGKAERPAEAER